MNEECQRLRKEYPRSCLILRLFGMEESLLQDCIDLRVNSSVRLKIFLVY